MSGDARIAALAATLGERLRQQGWLLATAESCTGGWIAEAVTAVAGSSQWFERGFVSYSNRSKQELLGVSAATLAQHGAVSIETAREMASGARAASDVDVALSVTGIAGPGGGSPGRPVGTVCFAWASRAGVIRSEQRHFAGDRESVRRQSVIHALEGVIAALDAAAAAD
jgi:nicotinamide-nucleotide amidase